MSNQKQWWAPIWTGLVMDENGTHVGKIKNAIWLYLYLLLNANRLTGILKRKTLTISRDMGISERTIRRWLTCLSRNNYIEMKFTGRCLHIQIKRWKGSGWPNVATQPGQTWPLRVAKCGQADEALLRGKSLDLSGGIHVSLEANDISIKKDILKIDIDTKNNSAFSNSFAEFTPKNGKDLLAIDLARELDDKLGFPLYLSYSKKYPESLLRRVLHDVKAIPNNKIKKSRGALFNHLVRKYVQ